jgi:hypothetical protein
VGVVGFGVGDGRRGESVLAQPGQTGVPGGAHQRGEPLLGGGAGPGERAEEAGEDFRLEVRALAVVPTAKLGDQGAQSGQREPDRGQPPARQVLLGPGDHRRPDPVLHLDRGVRVGE